MKKPRKKTVEAIISPFTVVIDTREQSPYTFQNLRANADKHNAPIIVPTVRRAIKTGDYAVLGYENKFSIERKSKADLFSSVVNRQNFVDRLARFTASHESGAIVIEAEISEILNYRPHTDHQLISFLNSHSLISSEDIDSYYRDGSGKLPAIIQSFQSIPIAYQSNDPFYSKLNVKALLRTIHAWKVRYPTVHWEFLPGRAVAEAWTYRRLEYYYREQVSGLGE